MKIRFFLALFSLFIFSACGKSPQVDYVIAPHIDFECDSIQSNVCDSSAHGKAVYMGLTRDLDFDCETELVALDPLLFQANFDYTGVSVAHFNGSYVWGVVTQWANSSGAKVIQFIDSDYKLCAFLDDNDDGSLGGFEVMAEETFNPSEAFNPIRSWSDL